jgi:glycosyltransferase involved in cell wall biosynthesis
VKILLVVSRYPWPPRRGDQLRTLQALEHLSTVHSITLLAPSPGAGAPPPPALPATVELELYRPPRPVAPWGLARVLGSGAPLQSVLAAAPDLAAKLRRRSREADVALLQLARLAPHHRDLAGPPLVADLIDSLALNLARRARYDRLALRPLWRLEARLLLAAERRLARTARATLVVSERDRGFLAEALGEEPGVRLGVVPLVMAEDPRPPVAGPPTVVFTGNLGYFVNRDGLSWWLRGVWPALARCWPGARLLVAGARPPRRLARAVRAAGGELVAEPADLRSSLGRATVAVAPLRAGSGVPVKVLEAWAAGVPVVASPWAAAGAAARSGCELLIAETPAQWVEAVSALLADGALRRDLAERARERLREVHGPAAVGRRWRQVMVAAMAAEGPLDGPGSGG